LLRQGKVAEAGPELREALKQMDDNPDTPAPIRTEANERVEQLKRAEADTSFLKKLCPQDKELEALREVIGQRPQDSAAHAALGNALLARQDYDESLACFREAIRLGTKDAKVYLKMGNCLWLNSGLNSNEEVRNAWRTAIRLDPECAEAHCSLGFAIHLEGDNQDAIREFERGQDLATRKALGLKDMRSLIRQCQDAIEADKWLLAQLPAFLEKDSAAAGAGEFVLFAEFCRRTKRYATSSRFWSKAFSAEPDLANSIDPSFGNYMNRFNAACYSALAGIGEGTDSDTTDASTRDRLRKQTMEWLKEDLAKWEKLLKGDQKPSLDKGTILGHLRSAKIDTDLKGIRDDAWLARWPKEETQAYREYWADHEALIKKYEGKVKP
jgi:tetratricopeptide (TPR) repeat protein